MDKFKIRCSAIGKIMAGSIGLSEPQERKLKTFQDKIKAGKDLTDLQAKENDKLVNLKDNPELPQGAKTYCKQWLKEKLYKRRREFGSKYTDKGNECEDKAIEFISDWKFKPLKKNEKFFEDEYMTGTPDVLGSPMIDVKCSWDEQTFPVLEDDLPDKDYYYQGQGYMNLCGGDKFEVIYCLMNAPFSIIQDEARRASYKSNLSEADLMEKYMKLMTFDDVTNKLRIKIFKFDRDQKVIDEIKARVKMCQAYIDELLKGLGDYE